MQDLPNSQDQSTKLTPKHIFSPAGLKNFWLGFLTASTILLGLTVMYVVFCPHYLSSRIVIQENKCKCQPTQPQKKRPPHNKIEEEKPNRKFNL